MVAGVIGMNGVNVLDHVVVAFPYRVDSVIIQRQQTVVHFVWVNEFDIKYAIRNCVLKMNLVLEHNNVPCIIMKHWKENSISGKLILIVVSWLIFGFRHFFVYRFLISRRSVWVILYGFRRHCNCAKGFSCRWYPL